MDHKTHIPTPCSAPVMPVRQVYWADGADLLQDWVVMLMLYEVEKFKSMIFSLDSVIFPKEQPSRVVTLLQSPLLMSSLNLSLVPSGQAHLSSNAGSWWMALQRKWRTGAGSAKQGCAWQDQQTLMWAWRIDRG